MDGDRIRSEDGSLRIKLHELKNILTRLYGVKPRVTCRHAEHGRESNERDPSLILKSIEICFNLDRIPTNCPEIR